MNTDERHRLNEITSKLHDALQRLEEFDKTQAKEINDLKEENAWLREQLGEELKGW